MTFRLMEDDLIRLSIVVIDYVRYFQLNVRKNWPYVDILRCDNVLN